MATWSLAFLRWTSSRTRPSSPNVARGLGGLQVALRAGVDPLALALRLLPVRIGLLEGFLERVRVEELQFGLRLVQEHLLRPAVEAVGLQFAPGDVALLLELLGPLQLVLGPGELLVRQVDVGLELAELLEGGAAEGLVLEERVGWEVPVGLDQAVREVRPEELLEVQERKLGLELGDREGAFPQALGDQVRLVGLVEGGLGGLIGHVLGLELLLEVGGVEFDELVALLDGQAFLDDPDDEALALDFAADVGGMLGVDLARLGDRDDEFFSDGGGGLARRGGIGLHAGAGEHEGADQADGRQAEQAAAQLPERAALAGGACRGVGAGEGCRCRFRHGCIRRGGPMWPPGCCCLFMCGTPGLSASDRHGAVDWVRRLYVKGHWWASHQ